MRGMATLNNIEINTIVRWGKNGKKYVWENPSQIQLNKLVAKYGCEQICNNTCWLFS